MYKFLIFLILMATAFTNCGMSDKQANKEAEPVQGRGGQCCPNETKTTDDASALPMDAQIQRHPMTQSIKSLKGANLSQHLAQQPCYYDLLTEKRYADAAVCFLYFYRQIFKLDHPAGELSTVFVRTDNLGMTHVRLRQIYGEIAVWPGEISIHFTAQGKIYWVQGNYIPTPRGVDLKPGIQSADALKTVAKVLNGNESGCPNCTSDVVIYAGRPEKPVLAHRVSASAGLDKGWDFFIDAHSGKVLHKISRVHTLSVPAGLK